MILVQKAFQLHGKDKMCRLNFSLLSPVSVFQLFCLFQNVLGTLPGVDQSSDIVRTAVEQIKKESEVKDKKKENK